MRKKQPQFRTANGVHLTVLLSAVLILITASPLAAEYNITTETEISWEKGDIMIAASAPVPLEVPNLISERFRITETIDRNLTVLVTDAFDGIYFDSLKSLQEAFTSDGRILSAFDKLNLTKSRVSSSLSLDLDRVTNIYRYNIFEELVPILSDRRHPAPLPIILEYEPTANFSGIVIYAADPLPYYGENLTGTLNPAIFPKIYNENMDLTASPEMAETEWLGKWGFVLYTDSLDEKEFEERIGLYPYRTTAKAVFGTNHTDILISDEASRKILYNEANHRLIREGRIVVIIPED